MYGIGVSATFDVVSLVLWKEKECLEVVEFSSRGMHTALLSKIEEILHKQDKVFSDIEFIVVDTGPASSFTGLRLSLAMIKSWAMIQRNLQIFTTRSTLLLYEEFLCHYPEKKDEAVLVCYFGFQKRVYMEPFCDGKSTGDVVDLSLEYLETFFKQDNIQYNIIGSALDYVDFSKWNTRTIPLYKPNISYSQERKQIPWQELTPNYYRKTQAEEGIERI